MKKYILLSFVFLTNSVFGMTIDEDNAHNGCCRRFLKTFGLFYGTLFGQELLRASSPTTLPCIYFNPTSAKAIVEFDPAQCWHHARNPDAFQVNPVQIKMLAENIAAYSAMKKEIDSLLLEKRKAKAARRRNR